MNKKARCLCRHEEHDGDRCYWESPGGDLVGQYCTCEEYRPCPHPPEKRGSNNHSGNPTCRGCSEHFESEEAYERAQKI
jgi:hypothetical protein